jgi:hypothetical protein
MVTRIYVGLDPRLKPAAGLSVLAHLILLIGEGRVAADREPGLRAHYRLER